MEKIKHLLKLVGMIEEKYRHIQKQDMGFNIFTVLRSESDEVNLHSQFIVELLSGIPHYSDIFLRLFLKGLGLEEDYLGSGVKILKEYRNIDILIRGQDREIIIENKIYAEDQWEQLERYYKDVKGSHNEVRIYYLTLEGRDPSKQSLGKLLCSEGDSDESKVQVVNLSYKRHISSWIEECIKESATVPGLRETLIQYLEVVNRLSGNTENKDMEREVASLLLESSTNLKLAKQISKGYEEVLSSLKLRIWRELEERLDPALEEMGIYQKYSISKSEKYSENKVYKNIKYHGLMYRVEKIDESDDLILFFEVDHMLYFGYGLMRKGNRANHCSEPKFSGLKEIVFEEIQTYNKGIEFSSSYSSDWWLAYIYPHDKINYRFPDDNFLKLADQKCWDEFMDELVGASTEITKGIINRLRGKDGIQ